MQAKKEQMTPREKDKNEKVKVILRIRPFFNHEEAEEFISLQPVHDFLSRTTLFRSINQDSHLL